MPYTFLPYRTVPYTVLCTAGYLFPYYSEVAAVIASVGDLMVLLGFPCLCALKLLPLGRTERRACWALVAAAAAVSAAGVVGSVQRLIARATEGA